MAGVHLISQNSENASIQQVIKDISIPAVHMARLAISPRHNS
jgi:hypothetical protein